MRLWLPGIVLCLAAFPLRGENPPAAPPVTNPAAVHERYQQVLAGPEFHTDESSEDYPFRDWLSQYLTHLVSKYENFQYAGQMSGLAWLLVTTLTVLAGAGLIYGLLRLSRRQREAAEDAMETAPGRKGFLSPQLYDEKWRQAVEKRDWHAAWLAAWLQFLSRLETRRMVEADRSRTNREYLAQLRAQQLPASALPLLAGLVDDYDRFIYGLRAIDEPVWLAFRQKIDEASLMLHLGDGMAPSPSPEEPA